MKVRLIDTTNITLPVKYATLSYCWGVEKFYTLTKLNLAALKNNVDMEDLPRTFNDAFTVLLNIGLEYVWIDALCIIQDSPDGWAKESTTMSRIYAYSSVTLSAAASKNSDGGLFKFRDPSLVNPIYLDVHWARVLRDRERKTEQHDRDLGEMHVQYDTAAREESNVLARSLLHFDSLPQSGDNLDANGTEAFLPHNRLHDNSQIALLSNDTSFECKHVCVRHDPWPVVVKSLPIFRRAWIFQERLLSPRTVYFASDQIYWECAELCASELNPTGGPWEYREQNPEAKFAGIIKYQYYATILGLRPHPAPPSPDQLVKLWLVLVKEYSRCKLTYEKDKLVAFSAVADQFGQLLDGDKYVAGLWVSKLPQLLLWTCMASIHATTSSINNAHSRITRRMQTYQAPTWSWASMNNQEINNHFMLKVLDESAIDQSKICITVASTDTKLSNPSSPTGAISMCELHIQGRLCLGSFNHDMHDGLIFPSKALGFDRSRYKRKFGSERFDEGLALFDNENIFCLEIATTTGDRSRRSRNGENAMVHGLMLCFTGIKGQYRRVGDFNLDLNFLYGIEQIGSSFQGVPWKHNQKPSLEALREKLFTNSEFEEKYYNEKEGDKYTFVIV